MTNPYYTYTPSCPTCDKPLPRGSRIVVSRMGAVFCSMKCLIALAVANGLRTGCKPHRKSNFTEVKK